MCVWSLLSTCSCQHCDSLLNRNAAPLAQQHYCTERRGGVRMWEIETSVEREQHGEKEKWCFLFLVLFNIALSFAFFIQTPLSPTLNLSTFTQDLPLSQQPQWIHGVLLQLSHPWRAMIPGLQTPLLPLTPGVLQLPVPRLPTQVTTSCCFFSLVHRHRLLSLTTTNVPPPKQLMFPRLVYFVRISYLSMKYVWRSFKSLGKFGLFELCLYSSACFDLLIVAICLR